MLSPSDESFRVSQACSDTSSTMEAQLLGPEDSITSFAASDFSEDIQRARVDEKKISASGSIVAAGIAAIGAFLFGYSLGFTSPTLTAMEVLKHDSAFDDGDLKDLGDDTIVVTSEQAAQFSSIINIGAMVGALIAGVACDVLGRRSTILLVAPIFAGMWIWTATTTSYAQLIVARVTTGVAVGVVSMATPLYISETAPTNLRGSLGSVNQFALTFGILASYVLGIAVENNQKTSVECTEPGPADNETDEKSREPSICLNDGKTLTDTKCDDFVSGWDCDSTLNIETNTMTGYCTGDLPHWRVLALVAAGVAVLFLILMLNMPESPQWLLKNNQGRRARRALMFLRSYSDLHVDLEIKEMERSLLAQGLHRRSHKTVSSSSPNRPKRASANAKASAASESNQNISYNPMLPPDEKPYPDTPEHSLRKSGGGTDDGTEMCAAPPRSLSSSSQSANHSADDNDCFGCAVLCAADIQRPLGMGIAMMIFQQLSGVNAVIFYSGSILQAAGMDNANVGAAIIMAVQVAFTGLAVILMDRAGRKILMSVSSIGMALAAFCMAAFFVNHKKPGWLALVALIVYIASFSLGMGPVPWLYMGEIFPAHARAKASSAATLVNWSMGFFVTFTFDRAQVVFSPAGCFGFFAIVCTLCLFFVLTIMPETKGKSFEQIQAEFQAASGGARSSTIHYRTVEEQKRVSFDVR